MLVLSRRKNEEILFPSLDIAARILRASGNTVRIGIDAPSDVKVLRGEILDVQRSVGEPVQKERAMLVEDNANERELLASCLSSED